MNKDIVRRNILKAIVTFTAYTATPSIILNAAEGTAREHFELRVYQTTNAEKKVVLDRYLENAYIPALNRMSIDRIGVFTNRDEPDDLSVYVLIPYKNLDQFGAIIPTLEADTEYQDEAKEYFAAPIDDPIYSRIQSKFFKAFEGMPSLILPIQTAGNSPRIFELRTYEGHNEEKSALKIEMFNKSEIPVMQDAGLAPVFYGQSMIGDDVPNLVYMLSATDQASHDEHWEIFRAHPDWISMKDTPKYKGSISKVISQFLVPAPFSQI